ncbi:Probably secreted sialidase; several ASP-boxes and dockerin domain [Lyngbya sp. PCC 8106]|nr:Probably secreted sialidase; several ASP-boxes and dockerin domain [Lyngbya sp. PCC 8106]
MYCLLTTSVVFLVILIQSPLTSLIAPEKCSQLAGDDTFITSTEETYEWGGVKIGAGGFVTGIVIHPRTPDLIYTRTDAGGAFRWNPTNQSWMQLLSADSVPGNIDYNVESIALDPNNPNIVYIALGGYTRSKKQLVSGFLLKSTDRGESWKTLDLSLPMGGNEPWRWTGERLAVDPNNSDIVYFASRLNGLWRSTDGGTSWSQVNPELVPIGQPNPDTDKQAGVTYVVFDGSSGLTDNRTKVIYVGVSGEGIYRTTDGGTTWKHLEGGPDTELVPQQAVVNTQGELITTFYRTEKDPRGSVWKLTSEKWQEITPKPNRNYSAIAISSNPSDTLFVVSYPMTPDDIYRSDNGGQTWVQLHNKIDKLSWWPEWSFYTLTGGIAASPFNSGELWLTNGVGVWRTNSAHDRQVKWSATVDGIEETVTFDAISPPGGKLITAIADFDGFYHDSLCSVPIRNHGNGNFITTTSLAYSSTHPNFIVSVGASHHNPQEIRAGFSENYGKTWHNFRSIENKTHPSDLVFGNIAVSATDTRNIVWQPSNGKTPYFTKDRGRTWQQISFFEQKEIERGSHTHLWNRQQALAADSVKAGTFYIYHHVGGRFLRSDDGGETWKIVNETLPDEVWQGANVKTAPGIKGEVWVSLSEKGLYRSSNFGEDFVKLAVEEANVLGFGKAVPNTTSPTVFLQGKINGETGVFRSTNLGQTWVQIADYPMGYFGKLRVITGDMNVFGRVFLGTGGNGFIYGQLLETNQDR